MQGKEDPDAGLSTRPWPGRSEPDAETAIETLRIGVGIIWALNLLFILDPAAQYFATFQSVALGYGPLTLGGPAFPDFVAAHSVLFAWLIAITTGYLAVAFLLGFTTRLAILVGTVASLAFFVTQFWMTFMVPGGTDVGAHPLYLLVYLALFWGGAGRKYSVDHLISVKLAGSSRWGLRWVNTPPLVVIGTYLRMGPGNGGQGSTRKVTGRRAWQVLGVVVIAALVGGTTFALGYGLGQGPSGGGMPGMSSGPDDPFYVYLAINSIVFHNETAEQCTPANFTVPVHTLLIFVIKNYYHGKNPVSPPYDMVYGTLGNVEYLNGSSAGVGSVPAAEVSQTISIMAGGDFTGFNVPIPAAGSTPTEVKLLTYFNDTGPNIWMTMAPSDAYTMMTPGLMMGTMTVV